jgi:hypothetical protein
MYFVAACWNVYVTAAPVPIGQFPTGGSPPSSFHVYVHGAAAHVEFVPSKVTWLPVTGDVGLKTNEAVGGGETTTAVCREVADVEPAELLAVTTARMVCPTSLPAGA